MDLVILRTPCETKMNSPYWVERRKREQEEKENLAQKSHIAKDLNSISSVNN